MLHLFPLPHNTNWSNGGFICLKVHENTVVICGTDYQIVMIAIVVLKKKLHTVRHD